MDRLCSPKANVDHLIISIRKLPFSNPVEEVERFIIKYSMRLARHKYVVIGSLADLLAGLQKFRPNLIIRLVDHLFEEIFRGLDSPYKRDHQRMIGYVRLLGELYNYAILSSSVIFDTLYVLINYGHAKDVASETRASYTSNTIPTMISGWMASNDVSVHGYRLYSILTQFRADPSRYDPKILAEVDPINDLFRAQLVVELLNTCGEYFAKGKTQAKLDRYLTYFQRYLLCKQAIPLHIEFAILDMFDQLEEQARNETSKAREIIFTRYSSLDVIIPVIETLENKNLENNAAGGNEDDDEEGDDEDDEQSGAERRHGHLEEHKSESSGDDGNNDDEDESDEEDDSISKLELAKMLDKAKHAQAEDEEFEKALRSVMVVCSIVL